MGVYAEIRSEYEPIRGDWQTHDLDAWNFWHNTIDDQGQLLDEDGHLIYGVKNIDIICQNCINKHPERTDFVEYRLAFDKDAKIILIEDLNDEVYWKEKYGKEEKEYWDSLSKINKIKYRGRQIGATIRRKYILIFRRKWLVEQILAPIKTPINYAEIGKTLLIKNEKSIEASPAFEDCVIGDFDNKRKNDE
jgi:hypothetical protein